MAELQDVFPAWQLFRQGTHVLIQTVRGDTNNSWNQQRAGVLARGTPKDILKIHLVFFTCAYIATPQML